LWLTDRQKNRPNLALIDDVVSCLLVLNIHFNGPDPNTRNGGPPRQQIPIALSYSVACILSACLIYYEKWSTSQHLPDDVLKALLVGTNKIAYCWMQFLAGDITDLLEGFE